jgi:adenylyl- and sulfurtransferase ThiI
MHYISLGGTMALEKNVKELINTGLGAYVGVRDSLAGGQKSAAEFVEETRENLKKTLSDLQLKGQTDNDEIVVKVRDAVKDLLKTVSEYQGKIGEAVDENYAKLRVELAKFNVNLPALADLKPSKAG